MIYDVKKEPIEFGSFFTNKKFKLRKLASDF